MNRPQEPIIELIRSRADLLRQLRGFFDARGFLEVQPPCLSRECVVDAYIDPIEVSSGQFGLSLDLPPQFFLQTSPEASMKRMLAAGAPSMYSIGPVFRACERGDLHNVEFTMLEWYEVGANLDTGIAVLGELAVEVLGHDRYDVCTYRQIFQDSIGFDPIDAMLDTLQEQVARIDSSLVDSIGDDRDSLLDLLLSQIIQPTLGIDRPLIVKNYPLSQAALARQAADDQKCAARFELFVNGIEIANGYDELQDADILARRFQQANEKRVRAGRRSLSNESALIQAMREGLPPCAGVALGVDRLLMVRTGASSIIDVLPFSIETA
jgi:lysyl-tRNA synthetase class 2